MNDFYVYAHVRQDNDDVFYIGKGHGNRIARKNRNSHHDAVAKKHGMYSIILMDGLSESDALKFEQEIIRYYVFDLGYGIDIDGYRNNSDHQLTNFTFGGEGTTGLVHTEEWRKQHSLDMRGSNNPMYGVNVWDSLSDEKKQELRNQLSERYSGQNNPMYGVSPKDRMSEETFKQWLNQTRTRCKNAVGEKNPNYGNHALHDKVKDDPELRIKYFARNGKQNGRCRQIDLLSLDGQIIKHFDYIGECAEYVKEQRNAKGSIDSIRGCIRSFSKKNKPYLGFRYKIY